MFHLAAQSYPQTILNLLDTFETNIQGTTALLEAIRKLNLDPYIHVCVNVKYLEESLQENSQ